MCLGVFLAKRAGKRPAHSITRANVQLLSDGSRLELTNQSYSHHGDSCGRAVFGVYRIFTVINNNAMHKGAVSNGDSN